MSQALYQGPRASKTSTAEKNNICLTQETELVLKDPATAFPGFVTIRQDRHSSHCGGELQTLVKDVLVYKTIA